MEITGVLRNWERGHWCGYDYVCGNIYDDVKERFMDGQYIHTSYIKEFIDEGDHYLIVTRNSVYRAKKEEEVVEAHDSHRIEKSRGLATSQPHEGEYSMDEGQTRSSF